MAPEVGSWLEISLVYTRLEERGEKHEMLAPCDLHVHVLVVVTMQRCHRPRVPYPEVDRIGISLQRDPRKGDGLLYLGKERYVFVTQVVIF